MRRLVTILAASALVLGGVRADDKPGRAEQLKAVRADLAKAQAELNAAAANGPSKFDAQGNSPEWAGAHERAVKATRELIDADPADAAGIDAILYAVTELFVADRALFDLAAKHHAASEKIVPLLAMGRVEFAREVMTKSPNAKVRLWATFRLAEREYAAQKPKEALALLADIDRDPTFKELRTNGGLQLGEQVDQLCFEAGNLNVGQVAPELTGDDFDGKPLKLSTSRGKVTLLVFWATWCRPCMDLVPHEVTLVERYAGRPFAVVGVNGDFLPGGNFTINGADGKTIDGTAKLKAAVTKHKITWPSFRHGQWGAGEDTGIGDKWNVRRWPTVYLLDEAGVIRGKWTTTPPAKGLDDAVEKLVKAAEAK